MSEKLISHAHFNGNTTHGMSGKKIYKIWQSMIQRCINENDKAYKNYGARDIKVCNRWKNSFEAFYFDTFPRTSPKHSIDRIDNNGNYEPSNFRWATPTIQCRNQRTSKRNKTGIRGVFLMPSGSFQVHIGFMRKKLYIGTYANIEDAAQARNLAVGYLWN